jgi:DNA-binding MarR family transcriptional regulator
MTFNLIDRDDSTLILDVWLGSHLTTRLVDSDLRHLGLTSEEFGVYSLLNSAGPATATQISRWTGMAKATVSDLLRQVIARGHLEDIPDPHDEGRRLIRLTDEGFVVTLRAAKVLADQSPGLGGHPGD